MNDDIRYRDKPWLAHYDKGVKAKLEYNNLCLPDFLENTAAAFPEKTAFCFQGYRINFRNFLKMVNRFAGCLKDFGIGRGDSVAILLPNLIPCAAAYYAVLKLSAVAVMNNPLYTDRELAHQFNDSRSKVLITLDLLCNRMIDLRPETGIRQIVYTSIGDYLPFPKNLLFPLVAGKKGLAARVKPAENVYRWKEMINKYPEEVESAPLSHDDVAMYQYTGGTTGVSKGAVLTHGNLSRQLQQVDAWIPDFKRGAEVMLSALPFFHVMGLTACMNLAVFKGWENILVPKPQPDPLLEAITKFRPTFAPLVPTMFIGLLNHPAIGKSDLTSLKGCFSGSAPLPVEVIREFEKKTGAVIFEAFGLTETSPATHANPLTKAKRKAGSIGLPISDTDCRIVALGDRTVDVPVGGAGELAIRGPQVMREYLNMPDETAKTLVDGWLFTGDIAKMDEEGYFYIVDRMKDMIISGGINVYPRDIEEVLFAHPKVQEACAIGLPHPTRGEQIKAFVVLIAGETATEEEMTVYCAEKLAKHKIPTAFEFRASLPKTNVGKILKKDLRREEAGKRGEPKR